MSRPGRLRAWGSLAALLVLAGCTSATTGSAAAGRSSASADSGAPSTAPPAARPARVRLRGQVAFAADRHRNVDLYLLNLPDGRWRRLTSSPGADLSPTWAPDGARLAFNCSLGQVLPSQVGDFEVCVVNADGSGLRRITDAAGISAAGGWSADGRRIVFASSRDHDPDGVSSCGDLYLVDRDGAHLTRLTNGPARDCGPKFTPDGRHVLFFSDRAHPGGDSDLYAMNADGSAVTRLTHAHSEEQEPAFTPCKEACP